MLSIGGEGWKIITILAVRSGEFHLKRGYI